MSKDLVKQEHEFAIAKTDTQELANIMRENLGARKMTARSLDQIVLPRESTTWTVPTISGKVETKALEGVLIHIGLARRYYGTPMMPGQPKMPPDCFSVDGLIGNGNPGMNCDECSLNTFGTSTTPQGQAGRGKACKEYRLIFLLMPDSFLPVVLNVPPTSLKEVDTYLTRLTAMGKSRFGVMTKITLTKGDTDLVAKINFAASGELANVNHFREYSKSFTPFLQAAMQDAASNPERQSDSDDIPY